MTLGELLSSRLAELGHTQAELARLMERAGVEVSTQSISAWMLDQRRPHLTHLLAVLDVLKIHGSEREQAIEAARQRTQPVQATNAPEAV